MHVLALVTLILSAADHWTTYVCLRAPLDDWEITEANPLAEWLFESAGLVPGLCIDSAVTLGAVAFLLTTRHLSENTKLCFFSLVSVWTGIAVLNNLKAIATIGLSLTGTA